MVKKDNRVNKALNSREQNILKAIQQIASGDFSTRLELSSNTDEIDAIACGINMLAEELEDRAMEKDYIERRVNAVLSILQKAAEGELTISGHLEDKNDIFDALTAGVNMMIEEINVNTIGVNYVNKRTDEMLTIIQKIAQGDYQATCELSNKNDIFDALGMGINLMVDDIRYNTEEIKREKEKTLYLYNILLAIRNINQLITRETDIDKLAQEACVILLETREYTDVSIAITDPVSNSMMPTAHKGRFNWSPWKVDLTGQGEAPKCIKSVIRSHSVEIVKVQDEYCRGCTYRQPMNNNNTIAVVPILYGKSLEGILMICHKENQDIAQEEIKLLEEIAGDIAFAIDKIKTGKELENKNVQLMQVQKMEAIGTLSGGIAHDFNNLLTAIKGNVELAMSEVDESGTLYNNLKEINKATSRAASLTRQLLLFSRKQLMGMALLSINIMINNVFKMLERLIGEDIKINLDLAADIWVINADEGTLEQVLTNLVVNARDAMPKGGKIKIKTENIILNEEECRAIIESYSGKFIRLSIEDTGTGMDQEIIKHIFEPFFSTKGPGKGTGLGLSVVYGIIKQHKGWINVDSKPGAGSIFNIYLPAIHTKLEEKNNGIILPDSFQGSGERILLVEDEKSICSFLKRAFEKHNYNIFTAENGKEALDIFEKEKGNFQLVISDMVLPDNTGLEIVSQLLLKNPKLGIIICSGYFDDKSQWNVIKEMGYKFIQKPFDISNLLDTVREVLNKKE